MRPEGNTKIVYTSFDSLWEAIRETELSEYEKQWEQSCGYIGVGESKKKCASALRTRAYMFKNKEDYIPLPSNRAMNVNVNCDAAIVGVDIYVPKSSTKLELCLLIEYQKLKGRGLSTRQIERISATSFIKGEMHLPEVLRNCCGESIEDRVALVRRTSRTIARAELLQIYRQTSKPRPLEPGLRRIFFSEAMTSSFSPVTALDEDDMNVELDPLKGDDFMVMSYDRCKIDKTRREGDETNVLVPWCVFNLKTLEEVWLSPGGFTRLCRYRRGDIYDINDAVERLVDDERGVRVRTRANSSCSSPPSSAVTRMMKKKIRARFSFDFCSGSCKSAVHSLRRRRYVEWHERSIDNRGKVQMERKRMKRVFICVDPAIEIEAHDSAWADDQIFFLQAKVEDIRAVDLVPVGIFRSIIAAPECRVYSRQRSSHDKKLRDELGDEEAEKILKMEILESNKQVRAIVDIANHLMVPCWIENPLGDRVHSLWNEYYPFMSFDYRIHKITYCAYGRKFQKPTAIMTNLGSIKLNPPCLGETQCEYKKLHDNHEEFCGYDGVPREISKLHPPSLVKSLDEQIEDDFYGLINEILFLQ